MAALSRTQIVERLKRRNLVISPIFSSQQIGPCSVDLRLGNIALIVRARGLSHVDPANYLDDKASGEYRRELGRRQKLERHEIQFSEPLLVHPGTLILVPTLEWVKLPKDLQGIVTARSSWAREGLNIATATFVDPGYKGIVTLELSNLGQIPIALYPGVRIAQIAFHEVSGSRDSDLGRSQFNMSFEPSAGEIAKDDSSFIPTAQPKGVSR